MTLLQFLKALDIAEDIRIHHLIGMSHMNIGICYEELKDYDMAANHLDLSIKILKNLNTVF
ncbi:tetratricopeptide repeat protein [Bacillus halotolerans]|uniref:tetratricopeptide repeat protein n=1 Tax=Bacillus halotolerans TaxID=260554 RepID=UPI00273C6799|nr:tetratricopeptide repeat protein [Bacillus halotolerans]MDP4526278.1 tetratricopeptide repeat protein [Bacillus halotolerans]MEC1605063.1 tetratricopeptide repeat protein [Bacillus halotolerans]